MVRRSGIAIVWTMFVLVIFTLFAGLAVDWGHAQLAKTELQRTADLTARAGAALLPSGKTAVRKEATRYASLNKVDGQPLAMKNSDVVLGKWNSNTRTLDTSAAVPDAVQVTALLNEDRGNAVPLTFMAMFGRPFIDVTAKATVLYVSPIDIQADIKGWENPWLAGMPAGTVANPNNPHNNPDVAGKVNKQYGTVPDPSQITGLPLVGGTALTFGSLSGVANNDVTYDPNVNYSPDGNLGWIVNNKYGSGSPSEFGKSDLVAPINAVIGVFLGPDRPDQTSPPARLDFSTPASRDFTTLRPQLKQVFFIGDGLNSAGQTQQFIIPEGATRLFVGSMDEYEWNNNRGFRTYRITRPGRIVTVK